MLSTQIDTQTPPAWMRLLSTRKGTGSTMNADDWNESEEKQSAWIARAIAAKRKGEMEEEWENAE